MFLNLIHIQAQFEKIHGKTENINLLENNSRTVFSRRVNFFFSLFLKNLRDDGISFMIYQKSVNTFLLVK